MSENYNQKNAAMYNNNNNQQQKTDQNYYAMGDVTRKPKPINPLHQNESAIYSPMPMFPYNSPKNPIGVMPFQPKGNILEVYLRFYPTQ